MMSVYADHKGEIASRNQAFKHQSAQLFGKVAIPEFDVVDAQRSIHKDMDFHQKRVKKQILELETMILQD